MMKRKRVFKREKKIVEKKYVPEIVAPSDVSKLGTRTNSILYPIHELKNISPLVAESESNLYEE